jgi:tryptophan-rich sensory protein
MNRSIKLILALVFTIGLGSLGAIFTVNEIPNWYQNLIKPSFNPPNWLFGPVWTLLYTLMGIALFLVWKKTPSTDRNWAIGIFMIQFALNFCWSIIFFKYHLLGWALVEILIMWIFILLTILFFWQHSKIASILLLPYLFWVSFATLLNAAIFRLN